MVFLRFFLGGTVGEDHCFLCVWKNVFELVFTSFFL